MELADLRWQRDALIKLVEELERELKKEKARMGKRVVHSGDQVRQGR
jgi:ribosome-associated translation inhibitor RaiA